MNSEVFSTWITQELLPKRPSQCVIITNDARFHKRLDIQSAIRDADQTLLFLPPYSPQLNPIEHKWAPAKAIRKQKHGSISDIFTLYEI